MAKNENFSEKVITPEFTLSFPRLDVPDHIMGSKDKFFSMQMLFDKKMPTEWIQNILKSLYTKKWGEAKRPSTFKNPWRDGDIKADESEAEVYRGKFLMTAKAGEKDKILLIDGTKAELKPDTFYAGCVCRASLEIRTFDNQFGKGISCWVRGIQFMRDGEPLASSVTAKADDFGVVEGAKSKVAEISNDDF